MKFLDLNLMIPNDSIAAERAKIVSWLRSQGYLLILEDGENRVLMEHKPLRRKEER